VSPFRRCIKLLLLIGVVTFPLILGAQEGGGSGPKPGIPQTDQQRRGEGLFVKNCPLCHIYSKQKQDVAVLAPTQLIGAVRGEKPLTEANARRYIMEGVKGMMPAFKYQLDSKQIDDIIEGLEHESPALY